MLHVARLIDDAKLATSLIEPIEIEKLTPKLAPRCVDLLARYGLTWWSQIFERRTERNDRYGDAQARSAWLGSLPALAAVLCARGGDDGTELVRRIARWQWLWLSTRIDEWVKPPLSRASMKAISGDELWPSRTNGPPDCKPTSATSPVAAPTRLRQLACANSAS